MVIIESVYFGVWLTSFHCVAQTGFKLQGLNDPSILSVPSFV